MYNSKHSLFLRNNINNLFFYRGIEVNIAVCKTPIPPFPNMWRVDKTFLSYRLHKVCENDMTFDPDLWPTDLNINRDRLLIKDYLTTTFESF